VEGDSKSRAANDSYTDGYKPPGIFMKKRVCIFVSFDGVVKISTVVSGTLKSSDEIAFLWLRKKDGSPPLAPARRV